MKITIDNHSSYVYRGKADSHVEVSKALPNILFIHGAQQDHSCWALQSRWFAHHGYNVFVPDLPGHGMSAGDPLESIEELAKWIKKLIDQLDLKDVTLVGHSMGSLISLEFTLQNTSKVAKLILIGSALPMPVSDVLLDAAQNNEPKAISMVNNFSHSSQAQIGRNTVPGMWMMGVNQRLMERQKKGVFFNDLTACNNYKVDSNMLSDLSDQSLTVLVMSGSEDKMTSPKSARKLSEQIRGSRLTLINGAGHALMAEAPNEVLDCLIGFTK